MRLIHFFPETNMANRHDGLSKIAADEGIDISDLSDGDMLIFLNKAATMIAIIAGVGEEEITYGVLATYKSPVRGQRIDLNALRYIPQTFGGGKIRMDAALREALVERLYAKRSKK